MVDESAQREYLGRIERALERARTLVDGFDLCGEGAGRRDAVRELELALSESLRQSLLAPGEGWLCEEHADDPARLGCEVVWVIDPMDGTIECVTGLPEWSISVGLVIGEQPVAGGVYNPGTKEMVLGSSALGVTYNRQQAKCSSRAMLEGGCVLASRQETLRGQWAQFENRGFEIRPCGSVAYKLALVGAGLADATWTLSPKHEWDIAAGVALVQAAGGRVAALDSESVKFNQRSPKLSGLVASSAPVWSEVQRVLAKVAGVSCGEQKGASPVVYSGT